MHEFGICGHSHENLPWPLLARLNYIHLMCEFSLVLGSRLIVHCLQNQPRNFALKATCVWRDLWKSSSDKWSHTMEHLALKVVHKISKWTIVHWSVRKKHFRVLKQWECEMICLRNHNLQFIVCCLPPVRHISEAFMWSSFALMSNYKLLHQNSQLEFIELLRCKKFMINF